MRVAFATPTASVVRIKLEPSLLGWLAASTSCVCWMCVRAGGTETVVGDAQTTTGRSDQRRLLCCDARPVMPASLSSPLSGLMMLAVAW